MTAAARPSIPDSPYAVFRLIVTVALITMGSSGMYVIAVVLPSVQADFGVTRADASLPYTLMMIGFGVGGMLMGWMADRFGIKTPLFIGAIGMGLGYGLSAMAGNIWTFTLAQGLLVGFLGCASTFAPLIADTSLWFAKRRGVAVAICASGNYLSGAVWPPIVQHFIYEIGWRETFLYMGAFSFVVMVGLALLMNRRPPMVSSKVSSKMPPAATKSVLSHTGKTTATAPLPFGYSPSKAQLLLCVAGVGCCVAMSMPQVHIVAYCSDLGYGAARGAEMLSLMLVCGIVSRLISGVICDRIGGLRTLLLGSTLQVFALFLFLPFDGLVSLYIISALFGLFQGGIVPSYAIIVREHFPVAEVGTRTGAVIMATLLGMALGGWMSGKVFDLTGSYHAAFVNGIAWNLLNLAIVITLLRRISHPRPPTNLVAG